MMEAGIQNSILWSLYSQQWPTKIHTSGEFVKGAQMSGLAYATNMGGIPTTQYYAFTLLSKYLKDTNKVYKVVYNNDSHMYFAYAENDNGTKTVIVVNAAQENRKFSLDFANSLGGITLYKHLYNPSTCTPKNDLQVLPAHRDFSVDTNLTDILPAGGLAVYTTVD